VNRREFLVSTAGVCGVAAGGTLLAESTRADVLASDELTRGNGDPASITETVTGDDVEYLPSTNEVRAGDGTTPFDTWARLECHDAAGSEILEIVDDRSEKSVEGVGSGIRHLAFGLVVTVDHAVTRDRDGDVTSRPNVALDRLIAVAPRTLTVTVELDGQTDRRTFPVGVGHVEYQKHDSSSAGQPTPSGVDGESPRRDGHVFQRSVERERHLPAGVV
jgi:hypothetical protein